MKLIKKYQMSVILLYLLKSIFLENWTHAIYSIYAIMLCALQNRCAKYVIKTFQKKKKEKEKKEKLRNCNYLKCKKWMKLFLEKDFSPR